MPRPFRRGRQEPSAAQEHGPTDQQPDHGRSAGAWTSQRNARTDDSSQGEDDRTKRGNWGDILTQMDDFTGVVLDKLDELGIADDTIVVWASR